jgi:hypothetical protein
MSTESRGERSTISISKLADCPFSMAQEYAEAYFHSAESGGPPALIHLQPLRGFPVLARRVTLTFGLHLDGDEVGRSHDEMRIRWTSGSWMLPDFRGTLRFRIEGGETRLLIDGTYAAPLGVAGRWFDAIVGRRFARASLDDLGCRVATYLAARQHAWLRSLGERGDVPGDRVGRAAGLHDDGQSHVGQQRQPEPVETDLIVDHLRETGARAQRDPGPTVAADQI